MKSTLQDVPLDMIKVQKHNVRRRDIDVGIEDLAASIKANTLLQPIAAYFDTEKDIYVILTGQRRLNAHHLLNEKYPGQGYDKIKCLVYNEPDSEERKISMSLAENVTQLSMSHTDLVKAITDLYNKYGDYQLVQDEFGLTKYMVDKYVKLSRLPTELKDAVASGSIHHNPKTAENSMLRAVDSTKYTQGGLVPVETVVGIAKALATRELAPPDIPPGTTTVPRKKPRSKLQIELSLDTADKLKHVAKNNGEPESSLAAQYVLTGVDRDYKQLE